MNFTGYPCIVHLCVIHHCVRKCIPASKSFNDIPISSQLFPQIFFASFLAVRKREITQVHLLGTLTGMHFRTQWFISNVKSLGPFRPVRPAGLDFQARPVTISSMQDVLYNYCSITTCSIVPNQSAHLVSESRTHNRHTSVVLYF